MSGDFNTGATIELILPGNGGGVFVLISLSTTLSSSSSLSSTTSMTLVRQLGGVLGVHNVDNTIEDGGWSSYQTISEYPTHFDFQRYTRRLLDYHSPYFQLKFPLNLRRLGDHRIHLDHQENTQNWPNLASQTSQTHQLKQTHQARQTHQCILKISWDHPENIVKTSWKNPEKTLGPSREHLHREHQRTSVNIWKHLRMSIEHLWVSESILRAS